MPSRAAWVEINLGAIAHNYGEIRKHIQKDAKLCAVVKADAYGHGAIAVARKAIAAGAEYLALATISEALKLREAGFTTPLLILGLTKAENSFDIVDADITQTVCRLDLAEALSAEAVCQNKTVKVHLAVDTGLGRIGVRPEDAASMARAIISLPNVELEGVFSHFALADTADKSFARIVYIKTVAPGDSVGYGRAFIAPRETRIATISVGYADGFLRAYAGGSVELHGRRAPIAGRICMDQCMIDVTDIPEAAVGDVVTLFGSETLTADEVAARAGTISYEVLCLVSKHVSRIYMK